MAQQPTKPKVDLPGFSLSPAEAPARIKQKAGKLFIGIPKHDSTEERRIPLSPAGTSVLVNNGHRIVVESGAGEGSRFTDRDYSEMGAEILQDREEIYKADIILKTAPPTLRELEWMRPGQVLISPIQLPTLNIATIENLIHKRVIALAFEYIKDDAGFFPFVRSMSEIAGNTSIMIASEYLSHDHDGKGVLVGGISGVAPANVLILGAGVLGEYAARTALGLGANVKLFDDNIYKLMRLQNNISRKLFTSIFDPNVLETELLTADVVIGAIHSESGRTPVIVTEEMVMKMKEGSIIIDVSIDQGGCIETSEVTTNAKPTYKKHGVIHYCVPNIPSRVSRTATQAISNILSPLLLRASDLGGIDILLHQSMGARHGVYTYKGSLCNQFISEKFGMRFTDVNLLFTSGL